MSWRYVEPCCGSASIALALLGARRPLLPYQGSKWRFRKALRSRFEALGFAGPPGDVFLADAGPWGVVAPTVFTPAPRRAVLERLEALAARDPREVYDELHKATVPEEPVDYSAEFLFLQRLAYSGKAVGDPGGRWASPGFNSSSAYGLPGTERFGRVNPMIPSLIRVLRSYEQLAAPSLGGGRQAARPPTGAVAGPTLVYLDPPYAGSTGYPGGALSREQVVALARGWHEAGATVVVSEAEALPGLQAAGWDAERVDAGRNDTSRFRGKQPEWITISPSG